MSERGTERDRGRVEVITGPMFSGKTEELLRLVRRALIAGQRVRLITHRLDAREGAGSVASHAGQSAPSQAVGSAQEIVGVVPEDTDMVAIDEAQFFGPGLVEVVQGLAAHGMTVVVAGLDVTFTGRPFEPLPSLMALAERVAKLTAICAICGDEAIYHTRVTPTGASEADLVAEHVGGTEKYQARCRRHFQAWVVGTAA